ncbi:MAG: Penicillin-binding protein A [Actinobacteria bacterium ADurb.Bin444]|nr:MAG: Penicillin-binding protein A [Actinobacteria bacterium ADurb.Bin444]
MERCTRRLLWFFVVLFLLLSAQLTYLQVYAAPRLNADPSNTRAIEAQMRVERGLIVTRDGVELARNTKDAPYFLRTYPEGSLAAPWVGYNSLRYGRAGIERVYNAELAGELDALQIRNLIDVVTGRPRRGADLILTVDSQVQAAAVEALGARPGAVVALDPRTGAVLAWTSYPRYDPNNLEGQWDALIADPGKPLFDRATSGLYPPGSVFKVVTGAAALQEGKVKPETRFDDTGGFVAGGYKVVNFDGRVFGEHDFAQAMISSVNTTFAKVGVDLGAAILAQYASAFGLGEPLPWNLGGRTGSFPDPAKMDTAHVAQVSYGQGELLVSPFGMALVASGIANGGQIMMPHVVEEVRDYRQTVIARTQPRVWRRAVSAETARQITELMVRVVEEGTGTNAAIRNVKVAGKTGTAEVGNGEAHAWFICFAPADDPQVAVAVIVENGGSGGGVAAPVAKHVLETALARR